MVDDIARFAGVRLGPGTLYGALARLEARGLIEPLDSDDRRRPYRLTPAGAAALAVEADALDRVIRLARDRLAEPG
jgi:DNA-binding PadR family transcriptional regulator